MPYSHDKFTKRHSLKNRRITLFFSFLFFEGHLRLAPVHIPFHSFGFYRNFAACTPPCGLVRKKLLSYTPPSSHHLCRSHTLFISFPDLPLTKRKHLAFFFLAVLLGWCWNKHVFVLQFLSLSLDISSYFSFYATVQQTWLVVP